LLGHPKIGLLGALAGEPNVQLFVEPAAPLEYDPQRNATPICH
jgi:hypothetical protein